MVSNERRRERYATDESYRERQLRQVRESRERKKRERQRVALLRGWRDIVTAPDNEVVLIYDPAIFWPIVAKLKDQHWECLHYQGPEPRPTHWRYMIEAPIT